jgi:predicted transcriptional regulator
VNVARTLLHTRRRAGLTQRELARRSGIAQTTIARIESGVMDPRISTLETLLRACGDQLTTMPRAGLGGDLSLIRSCLELSPRQRLETAARAAGFVERIRGRARRKES